MKGLIALIAVFCIAFVFGNSENDVNELFKSYLTDESFVSYEVDNDQVTSLGAGFFSENNNLGAGYNEFDSYLSTTLAAASYCGRYHRNGNRSLVNWTCKHCKASGFFASDVLTFDTAADTNSFVGFVKRGGMQRIAVVFTGTKSFRNWMTDLSFLKAKYPGCNGCEVHTGFLTAYKGARASIVTHVSRLLAKYPGTPLIVTGHSLGGALITHFIADVRNSVFAVHEFHGLKFVTGGLEEVYGGYAIPTDAEESPFGLLGSAPAFTGSELTALGGKTEQFGAIFNIAGPAYTFGSPRVGNSNFSNWFNSRLGSTFVFRVTNYLDPVVRVPAISMGFTHIGTEVHYNKVGNYKTCSTSNTEDKTCAISYIMSLVPSCHTNYVKYAYDSTVAGC